MALKTGTHPATSKWVKSNGDVIYMRDMHINHIQNAFNGIIDERIWFDEINYYEEWIEIFETELDKRKKEKPMKKSDLETGMLVELRNGSLYLVINEVLAGNNNEFLYLNSYNNDLLMSKREYKEFDIVKASSKLKGYRLKPHEWTDETMAEFAIWKRIEPPVVFKRGDKVLAEITDRVILVSGDGISETTFAGTVISKDGSDRHDNVGEYSKYWTREDFHIIEQ